LDSEEEDLEESDASEDAILPGFRRTPWQHDGEYDSDSDLGYQEDEENGAFSDDEDYTTQIPQAPSPSDFPFARPTNYRRRQHNRPSPSASAAAFEVPAVRPPSRRGRGNIRVVDAVSSPTEDRKGCSRHCSPPPASSRSSSRILGPRSGHSDRLSDAGPRGGRAGSPMPAKIASDAENDSDDGDEIGDGDDQIRNSGRPRGGWRSDDSVFGRHLQTRGVNRLDPMARHVSAPPQVSPYDGVPRSVPMEYQLSSSGSNTRNERRRARAPTPRHEDSSIAPLSAPLLSQATCPPALEDTPAMARSISRTELGQASGYLGKTLASQPPNLLRTKSLGSKVTFGPDVDPRPERLSRLPIHAVSADEGAARRILQAVKSKPIACPRIAKRGEDFTW